MTSFPVRLLLPADAAARGLLSGDQRLAGLVAHDPCDPGALLASAREAADRELDRDALAAALSVGLLRLEAPPAAHAAAARLRDRGVVAVVTGQQPGLLGGTALVLWKALAAAAMARRLEAEGVPAVPVFWHASEDHDQAEADHVGWPARGAVERLRLSLPGDGRMLSRVPVPAAAGPLVESVLAGLVSGPGLAPLQDVLRPRPGETFGAWVGRLLARVLGAQGIVVVEPDDLRALGAQVTSFDRAHPGRLRATLAPAEALLEEAGYAPPLALRRDALTFDVDEAGRRVPPPLSGACGTSWNVVSRVLAQDLALPVAAQVCGPAELGYVALLRGAHGLLGLPQPLAVARPGVTIVEAPVRRACDALCVDPAAVVRHGESALGSAAEPAPESLERLGDAIAALPPGRSPAAQRRRAALEREARLFAAALEREAAEADEARTKRVATAVSALRPQGRLQERVVSFLPWYAAGGDAVIGRLIDLLGTADPVHHVLRTEDL